MQKLCGEGEYIFTQLTKNYKNMKPLKCIAFITMFIASIGCTTGYAQSSGSKVPAKNDSACQALLKQPGICDTIKDLRTQNANLRTQVAALKAQVTEKAYNVRKLDAPEPFLVYLPFIFLVVCTIVIIASLLNGNVRDAFREKSPAKLQALAMYKWNSNTEIAFTKLKDAAGTAGGAMPVLNKEDIPVSISRVLAAISVCSIFMSIIAIIMVDFYMIFRIGKAIDFSSLFNPMLTMATGILPFIINQIPAKK
jgi:hypothetical protein